MGIFKAPNVGHGADPIVTRMVEQDKVPWYKKPNLRRMYFYLFVCCMGVEITSGFDSQLINTLQFSGPFNKCMYSIPVTLDRSPHVNHQHERGF
jgi:hypothetical protein